MNFNHVCLRTLRVARIRPRCSPPRLRALAAPGAGGTSAPNRARSSRRRSPCSADVPVLQQNTQASKQRTACANVLIGIFFFPPLLFEWLSFRQEKTPGAGCYKLPTGDLSQPRGDGTGMAGDRCSGDCLKIKSCCFRKCQKTAEVI